MMQMAGKVYISAFNKRNIGHYACLCIFEYHNYMHTEENTIGRTSENKRYIFKRPPRFQYGHISICFLLVIDMEIGRHKRFAIE